MTKYIIVPRRYKYKLDQEEESFGPSRGHQKPVHPTPQCVFLAQKKRRRLEPLNKMSTGKKQGLPLLIQMMKNFQCILPHLKSNYMTFDLPWPAERLGLY
jgi:hypothetical protein